MSRHSSYDFQCDPYYSLFQLDIASRDSLCAKAFGGRIPESQITAVWRHFLIVFPVRRSAVLKSEEWIGVLRKSRESYATLAKQQQKRAEQFRNNKQWPIAASVIGKTFIDLSLSLTSPVLAKLVQIISLLVDEQSCQEFIEAAAFLVAIFYHIFSLECIPNTENSPKEILMDAEFLVSDVYNCVKRVLMTIEPFFRIASVKSIAEDIAMQVNFMAKTINPGIESCIQSSDVVHIVGIYQRLFAMYIPKLSDMLQFWSILFSRPGDLTVFHYFYACVFLASGKILPDPAPFPMMAFVVQFRRDIDRITNDGNDQVYEKLCTVFEDLINIAEKEKDGVIDMNRRIVMKYQLSQVIRILKTSGHPDELMPTELLLQTVSN